jgi:hypothetical protein
MMEINMKRLPPGAKRLYFTTFGALMLVLSSGCSVVGINSVEEAAYTA